MLIALEHIVFFLEKGKNTVCLESVQAKLGIEKIALVPAKEIVSYAEYYENLTKEGVQTIFSKRD